MENTIKYKVIKNLEQYNEYCNIHESLMQREDSVSLDEIELLELLIDDYDSRVLKEKSDKLNPVELLKSLLEDSGISQSDLAKSINVSKQLINDILGYRRNISKEIVVKLAKHFAMTQEAFSRKYSLTGNKITKGSR